MPLAVVYESKSLADAKPDPESTTEAVASVVRQAAVIVSAVVMATDAALVVYASAALSNEASTGAEFSVVQSDPVQAVVHVHTDEVPAVFQPQLPPLEHVGLQDALTPVTDSVRDTVTDANTPSFTVSDNVRDAVLTTAVVLNDTKSRADWYRATVAIPDTASEPVLDV